MSRVFSVTDDSVEREIPFNVEIQTLPDDELLDIWVQTQSIEMMLRAESGHGVRLMPNYEQLIMQELQMRALKRPPFNLPQVLKSSVAQV